MIGMPEAAGGERGPGQICTGRQADSWLFYGRALWRWRAHQPLL